MKSSPNADQQVMRAWPDMKAQQPQCPGQGTTADQNTHAQYNRIVDLENISASDFNQIMTELRVLRIDYDRVSRSYQQLGLAHAELLLDQPQPWLDHILDHIYLTDLDPAVRQDIVTFLEVSTKLNRLHGVI